MKYKKILITGGAGFIGSHLTDYLIAQGYIVRVLDNLTPQVHPNQKLPDYFNAKAEFVEGNVMVRSDWEKALTDCDAVVHLAAAVGVGQSMYQIEHYVRTNSLGTALLLDILANQKHTVKKIIIASSMTAYGEGLYQCPKCQLIQQPKLRDANDLANKIFNPRCRACHTELKPIATPETAQLNNPSVYGISKKNQEELVMSIGHAYGIPAVALRFFNAFGTRQSLSNPYVGVAAIFLSRVKNNKAPLINEDGLQTRDFIYISDLARAIVLSLESDRADGEIMNCGSGIPITVKQVAEIALSLNNNSLPIEYTGKYRTFDIRHCFADMTKIQKLLDWKPEVTFAQGMEKIFTWSKSQPANDLVDTAMNELEKRKLQ